MMLSGGYTTTPVAPLLATTYNLLLTEEAPAKALAQRKLPARSLTEWLPKEDAMALYTAAVKLAANAVGRIDLAGKLLDGKGPVENLPGMFLDCCIKALVRLEAVKRAAQEVDIAGWLTHEDITVEGKAMTLWCRANGIPSLHVPHGNYGWAPKENRVDTELFCDKAAVGGTYQRDWYVERGCDPARIIITGNPAWDFRFGVKIDKPWAKGLFQLDPKRPLVTWASSWSLGMTRTAKDEYLEEQYRKFLYATKEMLGPQFGVSVHPNSHKQGLEWYAREAEKAGARVMVTQGHLEELMQATDCLITINESNITTCAAQYGVPVLAAGGYEDGCPGILRLDGRPVADGVRECMSEGWDREFQSRRGEYMRMFDDCQGDAARRVAEVLVSMTGGGDGA